MFHIALNIDVQGMKFQDLKKNFTQANPSSLNGIWVWLLI